MIAMFLPGSGSRADQETRAMDDEQRPTWPATVSEAVDCLLAELSDDDLAQIKVMAREDLMDLYRPGLGMWIRNTFGLWAGNTALLASCFRFAREHRIAAGLMGDPEGSSMVIIEALWLYLQKTAVTPRPSRPANREEDQQGRLWD